MPIAGREFNRIEHLLVRVPTYGPAGTTPTLRVHLLNRAGAAMNELKAEPAPKAGEQQIDLPLAALPPGEYVLEIKTGDQDGDATRTGRLPRHRLTDHAFPRRGTPRRSGDRSADSAIAPLNPPDPQSNPQSAIRNPQSGAVSSPSM